MIGLLLFGFIVGVTFCALDRTYTDREMIWTIILAMVASLQGTIIVSLLQLDGVPFVSQGVLTLWILSMFFIKRLFLRPKSIQYLGE